MKNVLARKFTTLTLSILTLILSIVAIVAIGFRRNNGEILRLQDLMKEPWLSESWANATSVLFIFCICLFGVAVILISISLLLGKFLFFIDRFIWGITILVVLAGLITGVIAEIIFATGWHDGSFTKEFNMNFYSLMIILNALPSLFVLVVSISVFSKEEKLRREDKNKK